MCVFFTCTTTTSALPVSNFQLASFAVCSGLGLPSVLLDAFSPPSLGRGRGRAAASAVSSALQILLALFLVVVVGGRGLFQLLFSPSPSLSAVALPLLVDVHVPAALVNGTMAVARAGGRAGRTHFQLDRFVRSSLRQSVGSIAVRPSSFPSPHVAATAAAVARLSPLRPSVACVVRDVSHALLGPARSSPSLARRAGVPRRRARALLLPAFPLLLLLYLKSNAATATDFSLSSSPASPFSLTREICA